jgi:hypothetical protein
MTLIPWIALAVAILYALHLLATYAEKRGWIYYRKKHGSVTVGSAFLEIQALMEPSKRHVLEQRRRDDFDDQESGDK